VKIYGGKKYDIITADSAYLTDKKFEAVDKKKFIVGEDIDKYGVLKINAPSEGIITTRNEDYSMYEESVFGEIYLLVCEGLDSIELPDGASAKVGKIAIGGDSGEDIYKDMLIGVIDGSATEVIVPEGTANIRDYAFYYWSNLESVILPSGITSIGQHAFYMCSNLAVASLPSSLISIGRDAFYYCSMLELTSLPSGLTTIDSEAFRYCHKLNTMLIPESVTEIGSDAFSYCSNLTTITFKGKPNSIQSSTFKSCNKLTTINVPWAEGEVANAPWGATKATINYNYTGE
jgi:hypothetical protein